MPDFTRQGPVTNSSADQQQVYTLEASTPLLRLNDPEQIWTSAGQRPHRKDYPPGTRRGRPRKMTRLRPWRARAGLHGIGHHVYRLALGVGHHAAELVEIAKILNLEYAVVTPITREL